MKLFKVCPKTVLVLMSLTLAKAQIQPIQEKSYWLEYSRCDTELDSLNQIPANIQEAARQAINKFAGKYAGCFYFDNGQVIDLPCYRGQFPNSKQSTRYDLRFYLSDSNLGIRKHITRMQIDSNGTILSFEFPHKHFRKGRLVHIEPLLGSFEIARRYAVSSNWKADSVRANFQYDATSDGLSWQFDFLQASKPNTDTYRSVLINAENNKFIRSVVMVTNRIY